MCVCVCACACACMCVYINTNNALTLKTGGRLVVKGAVALT